MNYDRWFAKHTESLTGKTVAVTGSTGGLGNAICRHLARLGASLILLDRNAERSAAFGKRLEADFPGILISYIRLDLEDVQSVKNACEQLKRFPVEILIHNAGAYHIPRKKTQTGYDNVFQINFLSPYYITKQLLPDLRARGGKVVLVGSIAHGISRFDPEDIDFSSRKRGGKVYGNAKRYSMFAGYELCAREGVALSVAHPGIVYTNITSHYPKGVHAIIKGPMKLIFMSPKKASLSVIMGIFEEGGDREWFGPRFFRIWGKPKKSRLKSCSEEERKRIFAAAEACCGKMEEKANELSE